jgi:hypothetical protein
MNRLNREEAQAVLDLFKWAEQRYPRMKAGCLLDPFDPLTSVRDKLKALRAMAEADERR